ncbi:uncharacterized protein K452DRAFT_305900 [Aplosporella prunicola CBS 121167]|uniref:Uncharacterized protein n=1 Tax=Aplosporella prunicola CBS 121167 TaxID=1176127 RepID=A0A6A6BQ59_9PEZI|nr:uncharacterized protein K452DRAFT_305900 [Aplosporella prunicola CBS 121167]KAF2144947.1 hypothetical protein K452DRAFT_305900 [Aplosporella prunicola CBS 121167]
MTGHSGPIHPRIPERYYGETATFAGLFVLVDIPTHMLDEMLSEVNTLLDIPSIWLATSTRADVQVPTKELHPSITTTPLDPAWRSPFIDMHIPDIIRFLKALHLDPTAEFDRRHFLTIDEECVSEGIRWLKGYRIEGDLDEVENE